MLDFRQNLIDLIILNSNNNFERNQDPWFISSDFKIRAKINYDNFKDRFLIKRFGKYYTSKFTVANVLKRIMAMSEDLDHYEILYNLLDDQKSKDTLLEITLLKILGQQHVRLSIENPQYEAVHRATERCLITKDSRKIENFNDWKLNEYDLTSLGYSARIHYTQMGVVTTFGVEQYALSREDIVVHDGDIVLDCGGCWGDTALYFSTKAVGTTVYSFEFIPSNIKLFNENVTLNQNCNITLISHPVWKDSQSTFYIEDKGPASAILEVPLGSNDVPVTTMSIDDLVKTRQLIKVDFIKMDIEGAEPFAIEGAIETLRRFRPKLAIAIYHCPEDFSRIALFLKSLNLGYKFYLGHFTPHGAETILFAKAD